MPSAILNLVKLNEKIDYTFLIPLIVFYFLFFWLLVSIWVYIDTKKRIKRKRFRIIIFFLNLIFGLPFMLLYILARPYDNDEMDDISGGGVNIPIINFVDKEGIVMALELKILPTNLIKKDTIYDANMKIGVNIESSKIIEPQKLESSQVTKAAVVEEKKIIKKSFIQSIRNLFKIKKEENKPIITENTESTNTREDGKNIPKMNKKKFNKKRNR
jgi:hypothetical protein